VRPPIATRDGAAVSDGRYVFHDAAGTSIFGVLHATDPATGADQFAVAKLK
jgi:hypothetical protein